MWKWRVEGGAAKLDKAKAKPHILLTFFRALGPRNFAVSLRTIRLGPSQSRETSFSLSFRLETSRMLAKAPLSTFARDSMSLHISAAICVATECVAMRWRAIRD